MSKRLVAVLNAASGGGRIQMKMYEWRAQRVSTSSSGYVSRLGWKAAAALAVLAIFSSLLASIERSPIAYAGTVVSSPNNWSLQLTSSPNPARQGDTITWTLTVKNLRTGGSSPYLNWRAPGTSGWSGIVGPTMSGSSVCSPLPIAESGGWQFRPGYETIASPWYYLPAGGQVASPVQRPRRPLVVTPVRCR